MKSGEKMREKPKYYILNKKSDFEKGYLPENMYWSDGLTATHNEICVYYSRVFDSCGKKTKWYKLITDFELPENTFCEITFYSSESKFIADGSGETEIEKILRGSVSDAEKDRAIRNCYVFKTVLKEDILISQVHGRYMWFRLKITPSANLSPIIKSMKLCFDGSPWINNLPEIYRTETNSFTQRFLNIFQSLYEDMERKIERTAENYTAENAESEFLEWLTEWYCIRERSLWNEMQLRYILENAARLYGRMGTKSVIEELCGLYLGEKPEIIEYYTSEDINFKNKWNIANDRIFVNPYVFTVIVKDKCIENNSRYISLLKIIESCKPAHMEANVIIISDNSIQENGYIGVNSYISGNGGESLHGKRAAMLKKGTNCYE